MDINLVFNIISCATINYIFYKYFTNDYTIYIKHWISSLLITLFSISNAFINQMNNPILNLIFSFLSLICIKRFIFKIKCIDNLKSDIMFFFIIVFLDSICYFLIGLIFSNDLGNTTKYFRICSSAILLIFLYSSYSRISLKSKLNKVPVKELLIFLIISIFSILLIYIFSIEYDYINLSMHKMFILLIVIGLMVVDLIVFHYLEYVDTFYETKEKRLLELQQMEISKRYYIDLQNQHNKTRQLIHDFKNHLQMIDIAYSENNYKLAKKLIRLYNIESSNSTILMETGSEILNIIITDKSKKANEKGISLSLKIENSFNINFINELDMITIFGNLLDNAIEAAVDIKTKKNKEIIIKIYEVQNMFIILISNPCSNVLNYKHNRILTSKNGHSGVGLSSVKKTILKYNGNFEITINDNICDVLISIPIN